MANYNLDKIDARAPKKFDKDKTKKKLGDLKAKIEELQNMLYAEGRRAVLVILQGMDASGKDGVIKNVFDRVNPIGCRVIAFKQPTELEMKHDFLWRIHQNVPEKGAMHIFNRSHYEDVLIQRVHKWVDETIIRKRYTHINNFEKLLSDTGTTILKFYLHISQEEQLRRLEERMNDKTKMWKYSEADLKESRLWADYRKAYEDAFENCSDPVPWHIVPCDQNWYKEYVIAEKVVETLEALRLKYPGFKKEK